MKFIEEQLGRGAIPVTKHVKIEEVRKSAEKSVCKILTVDAVQESGALYQVVDINETDRFLIMTCNHLMPTSKLNYITRTQLFFPRYSTNGMHYFG